MKALLFVAALFLCACSQTDSAISQKPGEDLYSKSGQERRVQYEALYRSSRTRLEDLPSENEIKSEVMRLLPFLFGPLTYHSLGAPQKGDTVKVHLDQARLENGRVLIPYTYFGTWLIHAPALDAELKIPVPYSIEDLRASKWQDCTDSSPEHSMWSFFWYFWEPSRPGCEHREGKEYQEVTVQVGAETAQTRKSYPEYDRMSHVQNGRKVFAATFAFGYIEEPSNPKPFRDRDGGMQEFRQFYQSVRKSLLDRGFREESVLQDEYGWVAGTPIGARFIGEVDSVETRITVVAAGGVDQMDLFARSYAIDHEAFFGWFGHSRVGSGFDADRFRLRMQSNPETYSLTPDYQLVYWAGCNSYSYYTTPFFEMKAQLQPGTDPKGSKNLDLISNGLPSLFAFNAQNAQVLFVALMNRQQPTSYQQIVDRIEQIAGQWSSPVLVNVLGDEDNQAGQ